VVTVRSLTIEAMKPGDAVRLLNGQVVYDYTTMRARQLPAGAVLTVLATRLGTVGTVRYFMLESSRSVWYAWDVSS